MNVYREKLLNALLFFAREMEHANMTKMCKLLYYFDFTHFEQTGYPAIGLVYYTFERGPVPRDFWLEVKDGAVPEDFKGKLVMSERREDSDPSFKEYEFRAKIEPDLSVFTPREEEILKNMVTMFKDCTAKDMTKVSHWKDEPWGIAKKQKGQNQPIDYLLKIGKDASISREAAEETLRDFFELLHNFSLKAAK
jgi:uncharacterized phage-associated protein